MAGAAPAGLGMMRPDRAAAGARLVRGSAAAAMMADRQGRPDRGLGERPVLIESPPLPTQSPLLAASPLA